MDNYKDLILAGVNDGPTFLRLTLSHPLGESEWEKAALRPVQIGGQRVVQAAFTSGKRHIVKNYQGAELQEQLRRLLDMPFSRIHLQATTGDLHVRISRRGKALVTRGGPSRREGAPILSQDRVKKYPLPREQADPMLQALGIQTRDGKIKADMVPKFRQINEFLRVIERAVAGLGPTEGAIRIVDCGCGSAYLTFAAHHYLAHVKGLPACLTGIDADPDLIARCRKLREDLTGRCRTRPARGTVLESPTSGALARPVGWADIEFHPCRIAEYSPPSPPDIVVSLHACDTATDDAIAQGVRWASRLILAAPCCQDELHEQFSIAPSAMRGILRHNVLRQRLADLVTDALRAAALRVMGYRARVFEFISPEHTARNLMIEAERITGADPGRAAAVAEYQELKRFWNVTPFIEKTMGALFQEALARFGPSA